MSVARRLGFVTSIRERRCLHSVLVVSRYRQNNEKARRTCAQPNWVIDNAALNFSVQRRHVLVVKGDLAANEDIKDDTEGPDVDFRASVHLGVEQFGCGKVE